MSNQICNIISNAQKENGPSYSIVLYLSAKINFIWIDTKKQSYYIQYDDSVPTVLGIHKSTLENPAQEK